MTDPAPPTELAEPAAPARPGPTRLQRTTALIATVGVVSALVGLLLVIRPIETPALDCGTALGVLLDGRPDEFLDPDDPPEGVTAAEAEASNDNPCRKRAAAAARPAAAMVAAGLLAALGALVVEVIDRALAWRHRVHERAARRAAEPPSS